MTNTETEDSLARLCERQTKELQRLREAGLKELIEEVKQKSFVSGYKATDAEALGILIAKHFKWDGVEIMRAAQFALEDANFHSESAEVGAMADKAEGVR